MTFTLNIRTRDDLVVEGARALRDRIAASIDAVVEDRARALGYTSAAHLSSYTVSTVSDWAAEAEMFVTWRDAVWLAALQMQRDAAERGDPPAPEAIVAALPEWSGKRG